MTMTAALRTTHLADAADALGIACGSGGSGMTWAGAHTGCVFGRAFTVQQLSIGAADPVEAEGPSHRDVARALAQQGDVIVIGVEGDSAGATWGDGHARHAFGRGVAGVLMEGKTRDAGTLAQLKMPVLYRGTSPLKSTGRLRTVSIRQPVQIAGVTIHDGDFVALDADGFVVIAAEHAEAVCARAQLIADKEGKRDAELAARA